MVILMVNMIITDQNVVKPADLDPIFGQPRGETPIHSAGGSPCGWGGQL